FLNMRLELHPEAENNYIGKEYFIRFEDFNEVVQRYQAIKTDIDEKAGSIIKLTLTGANKARMVDYLNETVKTLIKTHLDRKNQFATNTIDFIDSTLTSIGRDLKMSEKELRDFSIGRDMNEFEGSGGEFSAELRDYDVQRDGINRKIAYLNMLKNYLRESTDYA